MDWTHLHKVETEFDSIHCGEPTLRAVTKIKLYIAASINIYAYQDGLTNIPIMNTP